jgi:photosystem II stability/assembly factor-like uncharacterized protein
MVGDEGIILRTEDSGVNWTDHTFTNEHHYFASFFLSASTGWIVGWDNDAYNGIILKTIDGGNSWLPLNLSPPYKSLMDVFFVSEELGWVIGDMEDGKIWRTTDGGNNWDLVFENDPILISIHFADSLTGWVSGTQGAIYKTIDGGDNWEYQNSNTPGYLNKIMFIDDMYGWISGSEGLWHTQDGGENWISVPSPATHWLKDLTFIDENNLWSCGNYCTIISTDNGGAVLVEDNQAHDHHGLQMNVSPNPLTSSTTIEYKLSSSSHLTLNIYSAHGQLLETIINQLVPQGTHSISWSSGNLPPGLYYAVLRTENDISVVKMVMR